MKCELVLDNFPDKQALQDENCCPVDRALTCMSRAVEGACGRTTICRDGLYQIYTIISDIARGKGRGDDMILLRDLCNTIVIDGECPLSIAAANAVMESLDTFPDVWEKHCNRKLCDKMVCIGCYTLYIDPAVCDGCGECIKAAPEGSIIGGSGMVHIIKDEATVKQIDYQTMCPKSAFKKAGAVKPQLPSEPVPVGTAVQTKGLQRRRRPNRLGNS